MLLGHGKKRYQTEFFFRQFKIDGFYLPSFVGDFVYMTYAAIQMLSILLSFYRLSVSQFL